VLDDVEAPVEEGCIVQPRWSLLVHEPPDDELRQEAHLDEIEGSQGIEGEDSREDLQQGILNDRRHFWQECAVIRPNSVPEKEK